jgi:hypothetical protein
VCTVDSGQVRAWRSGTFGLAISGWTGNAQGEAGMPEATPTQPVKRSSVPEATSLSVNPNSKLCEGLLGRLVGLLKKSVGIAAGGEPEVAAGQRRDDLQERGCGVPAGEEAAQQRRAAWPQRTCVSRAC